MIENKYTIEDFISGDWIVDIQNPTLPLQVLYPMEDGLRLRHSYSWDESRNPVRLDISSTIEYDRVGTILIDRSVLEKLGFRCEEQYAYYDIDENTYFQYYFYEYRLDKIYHGLDEWCNHSEVRDIVFRANVRTVDELHHAFKMANVDKDFNCLF